MKQDRPGSERLIRQDQDQAPLLRALEAYVSGGVHSFHMPGHQQGRGASDGLRKLLSNHAMAADITQVLGIDDIHRPVSACKLAQQLAAAAYGSRFTYFLVNGSTAGNLAMLMAALRPGETILVPRNAHRSTMGGLLLSGALPVYYQPEYDREVRVHHGPTVDRVEEMLDRHPEARALFIVSPTYYGTAADVHALTRLAHSRDMLVLADEAWGPHLTFHPELPESALRAGADLVVHSTHKLLAGLSQASMLHLNSDRVDRARLETVLRLTQSTSPSYLLMASLDAARHQMATLGRELLDSALGLARWTRREIEATPGIRCFGEELLSRPGVAGWDETRLVFTGRDLGLTGYRLERILRYEHNIQVEMSDRHNVVALITLGHTREDCQLLVAALRGLAGQRWEASPRLAQPWNLEELTSPVQRLTLREAFDAPSQAVPLEQTADCICAGWLTAYPPGIPLLCPGEVVTRELLDYLRVELDAGVLLEGAFDPEHRTLRVVCGSEADPAGPPRGRDTSG